MRFEIQLPLSQVQALASRYKYLDDTAVIDIGRTAGERGYFTKPEFMMMCEWKTQRSKSKVAKNVASDVVEATRQALSVRSEALRIWSPMALYGVSWATSSVLLHLAHTDAYPILDFRALESLGVQRAVIPTVSFWNDYVDEFRRLLVVASVDKRTLDRALWQWSSERSPNAVPKADGT